MAKKKVVKLDTEESIVNDVNHKLGVESICLLGAQSGAKNMPCLPTGAPALDVALGIGGLPRGRIIEIFGPESSGKTTLTLTTAAKCQQNGGKVCFIDVEHAIDPTWCKTIGLDIKKLLFSQPDSAEEVFRLVHYLIELQKVDLIIVDSVASLATKAELEGAPGDVTIGATARLMSAELKKLNSVLSKNDITLVFTNQLRDKIGGMNFGPNTTTTGGRALKFYASQRIEIVRIGSTKHGDEIIGSKVKAKVVKNKVAPPFKTALFDIIYNKGIFYPLCVLETGLACQVISRAGSWLIFKDQRLGLGVYPSALQVEEDMLKEIEKAIIDKTKPKDDVVDDEEVDNGDLKEVEEVTEKEE